MQSLDYIRLAGTRVGQPQRIGTRSDGTPWYSSIDRQPVPEGEIYLTWSGLAGDLPTETRPETSAEGGNGQIHGGPDKAVYVFPGRNYFTWFADLGHMLGSRSFGENWSVHGVTEHDVHIGDRWEIGDAVVEVSKPRTPCATLAEYFRHQAMIRLMVKNAACGWYMRVITPGLVPTSGHFSVVSRNIAGPTVYEAFRAKLPGPPVIPTKWPQ